MIATDLLAGQCKERFEFGEKYLHLMTTVMMMMINSVPNIRFVQLITV
jgi:hypothetical protein